MLPMTEPLRKQRCEGGEAARKSGDTHARAKRVADAIEAARIKHGSLHGFGGYEFRRCHDMTCVLANELLRLNSDYTRWWPNPTTQQIIDHLEAGGRVEVASIAYRSWEESLNTFKAWAEYEPAQSWPAYRLVLTPPPPATEWVPLHEVIGRTLPVMPNVTVWQYRVRGASNTAYEWASDALSQPRNDWYPLTVVDGKVEVLTEGAES